MQLPNLGYATSSEPMQNSGIHRYAAHLALEFSHSTPLVNFEICAARPTNERISRSTPIQVVIGHVTSAYANLEPNAER